MTSIPVNNAIIVRHGTEKCHWGAAPTDKIPLNYIGRENEFDRDSIDREPTAMDRELYERNAALDYIGRQGAFEHKGAERQVDATYWNEYGSMSYDDALADFMQADYFMHSVVSVKRDYTEQLKLNSKENFQKLIRATWRDNVDAWEMFEHPEDVRWLACYHTDADKSLHCHIFTYGRPGDLAKNQQVSREGTRAGKEQIFKTAYADYAHERNERSTFLRDLGRQNIARQLGGRVNERKVQQLHRQAEERGWKERVPDAPDWQPNKTTERLIKKIENNMRQGKGSLSRDYASGAVARDLIRELEKVSPATKQFAQEQKRCSEVKAELKGFDSDKYRGRDDVIRSDRRDYLKRLVPTVERTIRDNVGIEHSHDREQLHNRNPQQHQQEHQRDIMPGRELLSHSISCFMQALSSDNKRLLNRAPPRSRTDKRPRNRGYEAEREYEMER